MTREEIIEGNKLIAEFMGGEVNENGTCIGYTKMQIPDLAFRTYNFDSLKIAGYDYHSSWDWLMPVVENIDLLHFNEKQYFEIDVQQFMDNNIESVYYSVVNFLKRYNKRNEWYNKQKQP